MKRIGHEQKLMVLFPRISKRKLKISIDILLNLCYSYVMKNKLFWIGIALGMVGGYLSSGIFCGIGAGLLILDKFKKT